MVSASRDPGHVIRRQHTVTQMLLDTLEPELRRAIIAASIPHWFNNEIIAGILDVSQQQAKGMHLAIRDLPICRQFGTLGLSIHEFTRTSLLLRLLDNKRDKFQKYSRRAQEVFAGDSDPQCQVEAIYHSLASGEPHAADVLERYCFNYRMSRDYAALNNLLRNATELVFLGVLDTTADREVQRQRYRSVSSIARHMEAATSLEMKRSLLDHASEILKSMGKYFRAVTWPRKM